MELDVSSLAQPGHEHLERQVPKLDLAKLGGSVHLVGIGGIGMSALARLLLARGISVSGSDKEESAITKDLGSLGAKILYGHKAENVDGAALVVVSTAIVSDNPELAQAKLKSLPVWHRSELLSWLSRDCKLVAVSGTHGKTSTTGMVAQILLDAQKEPSVVVGGVFPRLGANAYFGTGEFFVAEADESDGTHANVRSHIALITNIEAEHLENYPGGLEQIRDNMVVFANQAQGTTIICLDDAGCRLIRPRLTGRVVTYGSKAASPAADYTYEVGDGKEIKVFKGGVNLGKIALNVPGEHNKLNALGALAAAMELGITFALARTGLESFTGVNRRFQLIGQAREITVVDDYAHHPTEVKATLAAAREQMEHQAPGSGGRIVALFQPHQPTRLRDLWDEFCNAFADADVVYVSDIYIARGKAIDGINSESFAQAVKHKNVHYFAGPSKDLAAKIAPELLPGDMVLTIGAGDITKVGPELVRYLGQQG